MIKQRRRGGQGMVHDVLGFRSCGMTDAAINGVRGWLVSEHSKSFEQQPKRLPMYPKHNLNREKGKAAQNLHQ